MAEYRKLAEQPGKPARRDGDAAKAVAGATRRIAASYEFRSLPMRRWSRWTRWSG